MDDTAAFVTGAAPLGNHARPWRQPGHMAVSPPPPLMPLTPPLLPLRRCRAIPPPTMTAASPVARPPLGGTASPDARNGSPGGDGNNGGEAPSSSLPPTDEMAAAVAAAAAAPPTCVRSISTVAELDAIIADAAAPADGGRPPLVVLEVFATHCRACKGIARAFTRVCEVHREAVFLASNSDENDELMRHLGVRGTPTFVLFRGGVRIDHFYARDRDALEEQVSENL